VAIVTGWSACSLSIHGSRVLGSQAARVNWTQSWWRYNCVEVYPRRWRRTLRQTAGRSVRVLRTGVWWCQPRQIITVDTPRPAVHWHTHTALATQQPSFE